MGEDENREGKIAMGCFRTLAFLVGVVVFLGFAFNSPDSSGPGATRSVTWESYDVDIDVRNDGTLHVTERQDVRFYGSYSQGYAVIPLDRIESIENVRVTTEGRPEDRDGNGFLSQEEVRRNGVMIPGTRVETGRYNLSAGEFMVSGNDGEYRIDYAFESTSGGVYSSFSHTSQVRTIVLEYDVAGAIRDYPDAEEPWQQIHWMAISPDVTGIADVEDTKVTITLPEDVPVEELAYAPEPDSVSTTSLSWSKSAMGEGDAFDVQVAFPAITSATAPDWQAAADQRDAELEAADNRKSLASLMLIGAGILVVVGGGLALLYAWYTRLHESVAGLVPDILSEPPDDLPAGLVGALVDEQVHPRDIAAIIMDLDRRGIVRIKTNEPAEARLYGRHARYALELLQPIESAMPHEQAVLRAVFRSHGKPSSEVSFDALRPLFGAYREEIQQAMDEELVRRGYLEEMPEKSRQRWTMMLRIFVGLSVVISIAILLWTRSWTWWVLLPPILGYLMYLAGGRLTPSIARKTRDGAEVSARWRAFQRYLELTGGSIFGEEWKTISQKYLPWVVAFGIDHQWLGKMNTPFPEFAASPGKSAPIGDASPREPRPGGSRQYWGTGPSVGSDWSPVRSPGWPGWDASRWSDTQGASDNVLSAISSGSDSLFSMMGDAMEAIGSSSGSGGGASGRGSSRSFGGSSRSGGRSRSSSGGGRRGFS